VILTRSNFEFVSNTLFNVYTNIIIKFIENKKEKIKCVLLTISYIKRRSKLRNIVSFGCLFLLGHSVDSGALTIKKAPFQRQTRRNWIICYYMERIN